ncbi:MAG: transcriptional repressor LexA [Gemmobacter sp.]
MLTSKQIELLALIKERLEADGIPPSFDEMKDALDLRSKSGVHRLVTALEERGFIRRLPHRARALEILRLPEAMERPDFRLPPRRDPAPRRGRPRRADATPAGRAAGGGIGAGAGAIEVPIMGRIAAGLPIEAISDGATHLAVPATMMRAGAGHYALEVRGDSMIEAGISDGDIVIIREQSTAETGDIVVALIEDHEATLKRFRRKGAMIALEAANPAYETRLYPDHLVRVQGRLVGLIRSY